MPEKPSTPPQKPPLTSPYPIAGRPWQRRFPTPRIQDYIVSVREDTRVAEFVMPQKGDAFRGVDQQKRLSKSYQFATAVPVEQLPGFVDLYYVAPFCAQEDYNFTVEYPYADRNYPRFTRTYIVSRTADVATAEPQADTYDPSFGKPFQLTDHKIERFTDDPVLDSQFVKIIRVFEKLPSPIITSFESNQYQQIVTVKTQEVVTSVPPAQSALTEGMKQERTGTAKAKNTLGAVPRVFPNQGLTTEIPSMTRELWLGGFDEENTSQIQAGQAVQPTLNIPGDYLRTEKQLTEFKKEVTTRFLPLPQTRTHKEWTNEFGGGVLNENLSIDVPQDPNDPLNHPVEGFLTTEGKLRNITGVATIKMDKTLAPYELEASNIEILNHGYGYDPATPPTVSFNPDMGAVAHAVMAYSIAQIVVDSGGSEYEFPPAVNLVTPRAYTGTPATAIAFISRGVTGLLVTNPGKGYSGNTTMSFVGGGGSGAAGSVVIGYSVHDIVITNKGTNYKNPYIRITGDGVGATAYVKKGDVGNQGHIKRITLANNGLNYTTPPTVQIFDQGPGTGATATATLEPTGRIRSVGLTSFGQDYLSAPTVQINGNGTGAKVLAFLATSGSVNRIVITSGGSGYYYDVNGNPQVTVSISGGSRDPNIPQATAHAVLSPTTHVAAVVLDTPGNYTPGTRYDTKDGLPEVIFTGGTGRDVDAQYNVGGWPTLYGSTVDPKYGLVTNITKRVVPNGTKWRPGLGFTEIHPHDKYRSIMITSLNDPRSLPAPIIYPITRQISLPHSLLNVVPNWITTTEDSVSGEQPPAFPVIGSGWETDEALADISGSFDVQIAHGYRGPAPAIVMELFFPTVPDRAFFPSPLIITPSYGTATLMTTSNRASITGATAGTTTRRYGHTNRTTVRTESRTLGPVLTGPFIQNVTKADVSKATGWTPTPVPITITQLDDTGWQIVSKQVYISPNSVEADASAILSVNVPPSSPLSLPSGTVYLESMETVRLGMNVWMVRLIYVYVP